jgi:lysophospholipase L1-like esterase
LQLLILLVMPFLSFIGARDELPKVLIIGDSISGGYLPFVDEALRGKANVMQAKITVELGDYMSSGGTTAGVKYIDEWIGDTDWDVIHFNFGLHDIKHIDPDTGKNSKNLNHPQQASPKRYGKNLKKIVSILKASNAKLIFATITPYPEKLGKQMRSPGMPKVYNEVALKIMKKNDIAINDLYSYVLPRMEELQRPRNVHFTQEGSKALGNQVALSIERILSSK